MAKTINKTLPYGEVHGEANGVKFVQGGWEFDHKGVQIGGVEQKPTKERDAGEELSAKAQLAKQ